MQNSNENHRSKNILNFFVGLGVALTMLFCPQEIFSKPKNFEKIQLEFFGGYAAINPSDLNLLVEYDEQIQYFLYDVYHEYLEDNNQILSWRKETQGKMMKIKNAFPFGLRLKYNLNVSIAVSLGFEYLSRTQASDYTFQYIRTENWGYQYVDQKNYSPYSISVKGYSPMVGIHIRKTIKGPFGIEGYIMGGPLFAKCVYRSEWDSKWFYQGDDYTYLFYESTGSLEQRGSGTGFVLDVGGRINMELGRKLGLFLELGYTLQKVNKISGTGMEQRDQATDSWEGKWGIIEEDILTEWGSYTLISPTNYWENGRLNQKIRDFHLDLSGFQLKLGIFYKF